MSTVKVVFAHSIRFTETRKVALSFRLIIQISSFGLSTHYYLHSLIALGALILGLVKFQELTLSNIELNKKNGVQFLPDTKIHMLKWGEHIFRDTADPKYSWHPEDYR